MERVVIIGAGLAGLSAALKLAENGVSCKLVSATPSERAQSVLAEGGINGAINTMEEDDHVGEHMEETLRAGCNIADIDSVRGLTEHAPKIIRRLFHMGVPFHTREGNIQLRNFGGQKKKRTAYAKSSTGKAIMSALIDEARKYEEKGLIMRYSHHEFLSLLLADDEKCLGAMVMDRYTNQRLCMQGAVILAFGGMNGIFPEKTTGTTENSGDAAAKVLAQGVSFSNLEMIQYHPTTIGISGKRCLVSEAARGEGGRLFIEKNKIPWYFMEEKYPEMGNLMPRDVIAREMHAVLQEEHCGNQIYLDLRGLSEQVWKEKLPDLRKEVQHYLSIDPVRETIPVEPGIHYFMGGIDVDRYHRTNIQNLYAAGECCAQYHGANRLGGNSMLGALYGGSAAAEHLLLNHSKSVRRKVSDAQAKEPPIDIRPASPGLIIEIRDILLPALGIVRTEETLQKAIGQTEQLLCNDSVNEREKNRLFLAKAMLLSASMRKESRGAHYREDFPHTDEAYQGATLVTAKKEELRIEIRKCR